MSDQHKRGVDFVNRGVNGSRVRSPPGESGRDSTAIFSFSAATIFGTIGFCSLSLDEPLMPLCTVRPASSHSARAKLGETAAERPKRACRAPDPDTVLRRCADGSSSRRDRWFLSPLPPKPSRESCGCADHEDARAASGCVNEGPELTAELMEGGLHLGDIGFRLPRHARYNIHCKAVVATIC